MIGAAIQFVNCTFENNNKSAIHASGSKLIFEGHNIFKNNSGLVGGGIQLLDSSYIHLRPNTYIVFEKNHADYVGGAIYTDYEDNDPCIFHTDSPIYSNIDVDFIENTATLSGNSLYGDGLKTCGTSFNYVFNVTNTESDPSAIASDPYGICLCSDERRMPNCWPSNRTYSTDAFPGQEFPIHLAVVGASFNGVVPGAIRAFLDPSNGTLGSFQNSQVSNKSTCTTFLYSVNSDYMGKEVHFWLTAEHDFLKSITTADVRDIKRIQITVNLTMCPLGFSLSSYGTCACDPMLDGSGVQCNINNQSFLRPPSTWIGFIDESTSNVTGIMFHSNCPFGYCSDEASITSNTSDSQCQPHRTGLLCGECEEGYSLTLGDGKCAKCSNTYLLLILPLALAGLLLVAVLFALNLTVTEGSINGLIFYANVMAMNHNVLLSGQKSHLYPFLAWLNLDLGISTCLYNGMDGYEETWFQLVFPTYLWAIGLVIIKLYSWFPEHATRLGGENAHKVLTTMLLLSYTKLQLTVVTIMSFTKLEYPGGVVRYMWLYDANLEFFTGKHLVLGIFGIIVLVFLILPYTLCLTFFQQLQACSGNWLFQWVSKLKPVFDAYAGPYTRTSIGSGQECCY